MFFGNVHCFIQTLAGNQNMHLHTDSRGYGAFIVLDAKNRKDHVNLAAGDLLPWLIVCLSVKRMVGMHGKGGMENGEW